jgi:hypothetical protein
MKKIALVMAVIGVIVSTASLASAQVRVRGYIRSNGTYVQPHIRTYPDGHLYNNYSYGR